MIPNSKEWTVENIPDSFWGLIDPAEANLEAFRTIAMGQSREQLRELYEQYLGMSNGLLTKRHLEYLEPDASEDVIMDVSSWVVMQGSDYYFEVYQYPEKIFSRVYVRGESFDSVMVEVFEERFGELI